MAAYALGASGERSGFNFLEGLFKGFSSILPFLQGASDLKLVEEVLRMPGIIDSAMGFYNRSYYAEAKEKLLQILQLYAIGAPEMNVPHFDELVHHVVDKTRGLLLNALAGCEFNLGNIDESLKYRMEAVTIAEEVGDPQLLKISYGDLGYFHMSLGNYYSSLELFHKSLEIDDASHDPWRKKNRTISNLSQLYYQIGNYDKALEYAHEALELSKKENDLNGRARCLNALGVISITINEFQDAGEYLKEAQRLAVEELNNKALQGLILNNFAYFYFSASENEKARECLADALDLAIQMSDISTEATIRSSMAMLELENGNFDNARHQAEAELEICGKIYSPSGQADAQYLLGSIEDFCYDNPLAAYECYSVAIKLSESLREKLILDDFKISFAGNITALYQQMVSLCIRMERTGEAFEYIERSKSRAFVDMVSSMSNTISAKELSQEQIEEVANLKGRLDLLRRQISASYSDPNKDATDVKREDVAAEMNDLETAYLKTFEGIKMKDPEWSSLVSVEVADIEAAQLRLDEKTALLEFYQTSDELLVIVIKKNKPPSAIRITMDIEAESEKLFKLFTALSAGSSIDTRSHEFIKDIKKPLSHFYDLLISPLLDLIEDAEHLIIIPHLLWHYLPFHALLDSGSQEYLIDKFSISYAPSATALNLCMKNNVPSPLEGEGDEPDRRCHSALIFANPSGDLPFSEEEAEKIGATFGTNGHVFKRELASLDRLSEHDKPDFIHFACHGYFRGDEPLFSHLLLADSEGKVSPVFLPDIFNLRVKASLVTLSACETGLSRFTAGDELIGMSRAFSYAGTPALLTSLWAVNDKSTALLMDGFYEGVLYRGDSKAAALRSAIMSLKSEPGYGHPYFWSPFFLSGDWR